MIKFSIHEFLFWSIFCIIFLPELNKNEIIDQKILSINKDTKWAMIMKINCDSLIEFFEDMFGLLLLLFLVLTVLVTEAACDVNGMEVGLWVVVWICFGASVVVCNCWNSSSSGDTNSEYSVELGQLDQKELLFSRMSRGNQLIRSLIADS